MSCPDCARARLFSRVNGGSWWRLWFGACWSCWKRRRDVWEAARPAVMTVLIIGAAVFGHVAIRLLMGGGRCR